MEIQPSNYKPVNIPEVNINDSFWLWSLAKMSRDFPELWEFDIPKADAYEKLLKFFELEKYSEIKDLEPEGKARFIHNYIYIDGREVSNKVSLKSK